jgi:hypothetical protein
MARGAITPALARAAATDHVEVLRVIPLDDRDVLSAAAAHDVAQSTTSQHFEA